MTNEPTNRHRPATGARSIDHETRNMLLIDFEQAFVVHNAYRESERHLFTLSLRILAVPAVMAGALLSAGLISSTTQLHTILQLPVIWLALIASGVINCVVVRSYVVNDQVQTEAKHQVNRLRSLYLNALAEDFPPRWRPVWGSVNPYLDTRLKFKAAVLGPLVPAATNAAYVAYGVDRLLAYQAHVPWHLPASVPLGVAYFVVQLETTWNVVRRVHRNAVSRRRTTPGAAHREPPIARPPAASRRPSR